MVFYATVRSGFEARRGSREAEYAWGNGKRRKMWWRYRAPLENPSRNGFVPRKVAAVALGSSAGHDFFGFGTQRSGLKEIDDTQYSALEIRFDSQVGQARRA